MSLTLSTDRLLAAMAGVRTLVTVMQEETPVGPTDAALVEVAIRDLVPTQDWPYWLLALTTAQNRAVGVIEAWLDSGQLDPDASDHLATILEQVLARGAGTELNEQRLQELVHDAFGRTLDIDELVGPACFVVDTLLCSPDSTTREIVLGKA